MQKSNLFTWLMLLIPGSIIASMFTSCGKKGTLVPDQAKIEYQIINLGYDIMPVNLYINYLKQNTSPFSYPNASGYFGLNTIDTPFQIRSANVGKITNFFRIDSTNLKRNTRYTLYITGSRVDSTLTYIFTTDTSRVPAIGRGKVRFVNASLVVKGLEGGLDVTANDTIAFKAIKYKGISDYIEMSAGRYNFAVRATNDKQRTILKSLPSTSIDDGKLYTIYTYGIAGRTDTAAFGVAIINNR